MTLDERNKAIADAQRGVDTMYAMMESYKQHADVAQGRLNALLAEKAAQPEGPWVPRAGDLGFIIEGGGGVTQAVCIHSFYVAQGMVAPTLEAAERKAKRIAVFNKLWDLAEASGPIGDRWYEPLHWQDIAKWEPTSRSASATGLGRFATEESCDAAIAACDMSALVHEGAR